MGVTQPEPPAQPLPAAPARSRNGLGVADTRAQLGSFTMPVAIVVGEEDYATPVAMARQLHGAITQSTLAIIPRARHLTPIECPDRIAAELRDLLARR